jgi:hypothetical protein
LIGTVSCIQIYGSGAAKFPEPVTAEERQESARDAIQRAVKDKADHYSRAKDITLLVIPYGSLSAEEMVTLTEPWKNCFHAICLLSFMDVVIAWPELCVLRGKEPF